MISLLSSLSIRFFIPEEKKIFYDIKITRALYFKDLDIVNKNPNENIY